MKREIAVVVVLLSGASCKDGGGGGGGDGKVDVARLAARKLADEAYPRWSMQNPTSACPGSLADLGAADPNDPWGHPYVLLCGDNVPAGVHGIAVLSLGPDGAQGTADDIKSWQ